jgi:hypothetical protein
VRPQIGFDCMVFLNIGRPSEGLKNPKHGIPSGTSSSFVPFFACAMVAIDALSGGLIFIGKPTWL